MSDPNTTSTGPTTGPSTPPQGDWRDMRRAERQARRAAWRENGRPGWGGVPIGGLIILAIGVVVLAGNFGYHSPGPWWSVVLLIPAVGLLVTAIRFYRADNTFGSRAMGPAIGGILLLALALSIFFGVNLGLFWPVVLIVVGGAIVLRGMRR